MRQAVITAALLLVAPLVSGADAPNGPQARGKQLFTHRCGMCHREGGTGTFTLARRLGADQSLLESRNNLQPEYVRFVVRWGLVNMPRISRVELTDADLADVVTYLTAPKAP